MEKYDISAVIQMAWEDDVPFEAIYQQYGLSESECIALMRRELKPSSFRLWRKRVTGRKSKHSRLS
ncbi:MAG: TIGR03643 family protein [Pseudomonadota bacterium]|nr:TIGR03643 family protein [Pseudomonadota bacterium]